MLDVLFDGRNLYLRYDGCVVGSLVRGIFSSRGGIGKMDGLCTWVEM